MHIGVVTLFPAMLDCLYSGGIVARALERGLVQLTIWNPRDFTNDRHRRVDDRPYGGGPGMVMQVQPLRDCIGTAVSTMGSDTQVIALSPQGRRLDQAGVQSLLNHPRLLLVAGRYEGIDERVMMRDIHTELSIGDYVLSGGEPAAIVLIDALIRCLPGALGDEASATEDSFWHGLLDHPHYTRPGVIDEQSVPDVLLQGNHAEIARWRLKQSLGRTWLRRADLLLNRQLTIEQQTLLNEFIEEQGETGDDTSPYCRD